MSNTMLHGVLNKPISAWTKGVVDNMLRRSRYVEASRLIKKQEAEIKKLKEIIERPEANNETT